MSDLKPKNARSMIWKYFEPMDTKTTKCLLCEQIYRNSGNTTNLIDHLKRKHRHEFNQVNNEMKISSQASINNSNNNDDDDVIIHHDDIVQQQDDQELPIAIDGLQQHDHHQDDKNELQQQEVIDEVVDEDLIGQQQQQHNVVELEQHQLQHSTMDDNSIQQHQQQIQMNKDDQQQNDETDQLNQELQEEIHNAQIIKIVPLPHARSEVWNYFGFVANEDGQIVDRTKAVCKICASTFCYSGNTTNFYSHLKSMHSEIQMRSVQNLKTNNNQNQQQQQQNNQNRLKRTYANMMQLLDDNSNLLEINDFNNSSSTLNNNHHNENNSNNNSYSINNNNDSINLTTIMDLPFPERSSLENDLIHVDDITQFLLDFLINDCRPLCILQGKGFQRLLRLLAPGYQIPDSIKLKNLLRKRLDQLRKDSLIQTTTTTATTGIGGSSSSILMSSSATTTTTNNNNNFENNLDL